MAVLHNIEITIQVNGQDLREYFDEAGSPTQTSVTKYIEAVSGARFEITFMLSTSHKFISDVLGVEIFLDGRRAEKGLIEEATVHSWGRYQRYQRQFEGAYRVEGREWRMRPFLFAEISTVDEPLAGGYAGSRHGGNVDLGSICVKVFNKNLLRTGVEGRRGEELPQVDKLTEKELKGRNVTHNVALGKAQKVAPREIFRAEYVGREDAPVATFTFKYRSRKALQNLELVPRDPSPERPSTPIPLEERLFETLTLREKEELARRQQARYQAERSASVKGESRVKSESVLKRKRDEEVEELIASSSARKASVRPFVNGEVIELD